MELPPDAEKCGPAALMKLRDVATGDVFRFARTSAPARKLGPDSSALALAAQRLRADASRPSEILFFSKFGKQEAAGAGMRAELAYAMSEGRTVLTAVKRRCFRPGETSPAARAPCSKAACGGAGLVGLVSYARRKRHEGGSASDLVLRDARFAGSSGRGRSCCAPPSAPCPAATQTRFFPV